MLNNCSLNGRLVKEPELRYTQDGVAVANFTLAVQRNRKDDEGNYPADFIDCVVFRNSAEFIAERGKKGNRVSVSGRIQTRYWEDKKGNSRKNTEVIVNQLNLIDWGDNDSNDNNSQDNNKRQNNQEDPIDVPF